MMMSLLMFVFVATISPGGATTLAMASGMQFGILKSIPLIAGLAVGLAVLAGSASLGLASIILSSPQFSLLLKLAGSTYLIWLAWLIANAPVKQASNTEQMPMTLFKGLFLMWLNPKAWAMTLSASASFLFTDQSVLINVAIFSGIFLLGASVSLTFWSCIGRTAASLIKTDRQWQLINITMGLLIALSVFTIWI